MEVMHTPIPWKYREGLALIVPAVGEGCIAGLSGGVMSEEERKGNGLLIVLACNSHERLLAACKAIVPSTDYFHNDCVTVLRERLTTIRNRALRAIAEAKETTS